jgi:hypothetical protein
VFFKMMHDGIDDNLPVREHVRIGEPKYAIALPHQPLRARFVVKHRAICSVLVAVKLNDQLRGRTVEIDNIGTNRLLPSKP